MEGVEPHTLSEPLFIGETNLLMLGDQVLIVIFYKAKPGTFSESFRISLELPSMCPGSFAREIPKSFRRYNQLNSGNVWM